MEVKLKQGIKVLLLSFPFPPEADLPCTFNSSKSTVHLAYIYRVHKYNNNPPNGPHGH